MRIKKKLEIIEIESRMAVARGWWWGKQKDWLKGANFQL